jgi:anti-anti-sigma regulatory factor
VCDLAALQHVDAGTVDALARLQLAVRRSGCELRLRHAPEELQSLLEFVGLSETLRLEPEREAEQREDPLGVEEERQLGDPAVRDLDDL